MMVKQTTRCFDGAFQHWILMTVRGQGSVLQVAGQLGTASDPAMAMHGSSDPTPTVLFWQ
jgi:hypothetical protein